MQKPLSSVESRLQEIGRAILDGAQKQKQSFWARERWEENLMRKSMDNEHFRVQALRFIDVLPVLTRDKALVAHLREYFGDDELPLPGVARWGLARAGGALAAHIMAPAVRAAMQKLGKRFIGGSNTTETGNTVEKLRNSGMNFTLDLLGEAAVSEAEAESYQTKYLDLLESLSAAVRQWPDHPALDRQHGRLVPRCNLSVKLSSLFSQSTPVDPAGNAAAIKDRLRPIFQSARQNGAFILLDMELYDSQETTLRVFQELLEEPDFSDWPDVGVVIQAYLKNAEATLRTLVAWAKVRGTPITIRLVRGAYWDYETVMARQHGWDIPVWTGKSATDRCYERCLALLLEHYPTVETAVATHNVRSLAMALALAEERGLTRDQYEIQMLYGMADPLKNIIRDMGHQLRVYVPFGELIPGMAYLVRRLLENTASQSFLRMGFAENLPPEILLAPPTESTPAVPRSGSETMTDGPTGTAPFQNTPIRRFTSPEERQTFSDAIARIRGALGREYPLIIEGREIPTDAVMESVNPARPSEVIGSVTQAGIRDADTAMQTARAAFPDWRDRSATQRSDILRKAATLLKEQRDDFAALEIFEAGKSWQEADGDVVEAIDFLEYYAREAVRLAAVRPLHAAGEINDYFYQPRGVGIIIAPWNFPLAILTGMLSAAIVTGNTVVVKPAPQTPIVALRMMQLLREAGVPDGVVTMLPGAGPEIGEYLVRRPDAHFIAFTGSRAVGCRINQVGAELQNSQRHLKRIIAEMGGKNAIIIDDDADLDDAVQGTIFSAFGFQGQKCSAASRAIVVGDIQDAFVSRLVEAARSIRIGPPEAPGNFMGPVIDNRALDNIHRAIQEGQAVATLRFQQDVSHLEDGYFIGPTIFTDVPPGSPLAQEEIFGPVLSVLRARDFTDALAIANQTDYALTGGVYSRSPAHLQEARRDFQVGNLYLNRTITGAVVGRQPFGGYKMSGVGSKAGGPDYLLQFCEPRTITENTIRRGFSPDSM